MLTSPVAVLKRSHPDLGAWKPSGPVKVRGIGLDRVVLWMLCLFAFVIPTDLRFVDGKSIAMRLGYACLLLGVLGILRRGSAVMPPIGFWCLVGFAVWSTCTLAWAEYPAAAQHKVLQYWTLLVITAMIPQYAWNPRTRGILIDAYVAGCCMGVAGTIANMRAGREYGDGALPDMAGRYSYGTDPNYLALALVIGIPLALYRFRQVSASWRKIAYLLYVPVSLLGIELTGSRGALMALVAMVLTYVALSGWKARVSLVASLLLLLLGMWIVPSNLSTRFATIPDELRHGTLSDRRELWDRGIAVAEEHPIEGIGAGATSGKMYIAAHNTPLELTMEGGLVSLVLFYGAALLGLITTWRASHREGRMMLIVFAAWMVGSLSLSWEVDTVTWFLLSAMFAAVPAHSFYVRRASEASLSSAQVQA